MALGPGDQKKSFKLSVQVSLKSDNRTTRFQSISIITVYIALLGRHFCFLQMMQINAVSYKIFYKSDCATMANWYQYSPRKREIEV